MKFVLNDGSLSFDILIYKKVNSLLNLRISLNCGCSNDSTKKNSSLFSKLYLKVYRILCNVGGSNSIVIIC